MIFSILSSGGHFGHRSEKFLTILVFGREPSRKHSRIV